MTELLNLREAHAEQTDIRHRLLKNGYRPLPTAEKVAFLKAWPSIPVTDRVIDGWPMMISRYGENETLRSVPAVTTAIQLQGTMLAIDVDVQDQAAVIAIEDLMLELFPDVYDAAPYRTSGGTKFMLLARTPEPYAMWRTAKYVDPDGRDHMVEVYGGAVTRYFSCWGPHTLGGIVDGKYEVIKSYEWLGGDNPLTMAPDELPELSVDLLHEFMQRVADLLAAQPGWERVKGSTEGASSAGTVYDLTEDMVFHTAEGDLDYWDAVAYAMVTRDARCSASFLDGTSGNVTRCRMSAIGDTETPALQVFDNESWEMHMPASWSPRSPEERAERVGALGDRIAALMPQSVDKALLEASEAGAETDAFEARLDELREELAFNYVTGQFHFLRRGLIWSGISKSTLKDDLRQYDLTWEGPRGGQRRFSIVDAWSSYPDKNRIAGVRFDPRTEERIYTGDDGELYGNGFFGLPAIAPTSAHTRGIVKQFLEHLIPDDAERSWFWQWLATKYQKPWERNCAVLFIAPGVQGAGRGTLFAILDRVFGRYTSIVSESDLLGARFNGFMENSLILFSNELGGLGWAERKQGYETLKDRVDPSHSDVTIERKGIDSYRTRTFTSFMLASNNPAGLVLDAEDRRFAIITNGTKLEGELLDAILDVGYDELAAAFAEMLEGSELYTTVSDAPQFAGREHMLSANDTDIDDAIRAVVEKSEPGRAWVRSDFEKLVKLEITGSTSTHVKGLRQTVTDLVGKRGERLGANRIEERVNIPGTKVSVVARDPKALLALSLENRAKVLKGLAPDGKDETVVPFRKPPEV
jgi:hypothetical protein